MAKETHPRPRSGYAFFSDHSADFREIPNDDWETGVFSDTHLKGAKYVGDRVVDGSRVHVWIQKGGARYIAQTAIGSNPVSTGAKVAIGAGVVALLAAIFWPKSAKAATSTTSTTTTTTPPTPTPPVVATNPNPTNNQVATVPGAPASPAPIADPAALPAPIAALDAVAAFRTYDPATKTWSAPQFAHIDPTNALDVAAAVLNPQNAQVNLPAIFAAVPQYHPVATDTTPPTYQEVQLWYAVNGNWTFLQRFNNYSTAWNK